MTDLVKPLEKPRWATDVTADVITPSIGKQDVGWIVEAPPHDYFNWLHLWTYNWLQYFEAKSDTDFGGSAEAALTIASGAITPTVASNIIDTEAAAATDDLANIVTTNLQDGRVIIIRSANAGRVITIKHNAGGAGQISLIDEVDLVLSNPLDAVILKRVGADWHQIVKGTSKRWDTNANNLNVYNDVTLNKAGAAASAAGVGFNIEEDSLITGYVRASTDRNSFDVKAPNNANVSKLTPCTQGFIGSIPLGAVIGTMPYLVGAYNCTATTAADESGFVQCNGQTISDATSPMNGAVIPNINNNVFLAGSTTSGTVGGANTKDISHTHSVTSNVAVANHADHTHSVTSNVTFGSSTINTSGGSASFNKNELNSDQNTHKHLMGIETSNGTRYTTGTAGADITGGYSFSLTAAAYTPGTSTITSSGTTYTPYYVSGSLANWNSVSVSTTFTQPSFNQNLLSPTNNAVTSGGVSAAGAYTHTVTNNAVTSATGGSSSFDVRPSYITAKYVMRIK